MLGAKANISHSTDEATALYIASKQSYVDVVKVLLQYHPNIDIGTKDKLDLDATPLEIALKGDHTEIARLRLEAGADVNQRAQLNNFPLQ